MSHSSSVYNDVHFKLDVKEIEWTFEIVQLCYISL